MIERHYQIPFVSRLALNEKQIQQNYRPLIAVHKWFARRPGTLFRALLLSEFGGAKVEDTYFQAHNFHEKHILDPFMGGGTTVVEANRLGCQVTASDINPMAWWIVRQELCELDLAAHKQFREICSMRHRKQGSDISYAIRTHNKPKTQKSSQPRPSRPPVNLPF